MTSDRQQHLQATTTAFAALFQHQSTFLGDAATFSADTLILSLKATSSPTALPIGSITKLFTLVGILILSHQKKLVLTNPVCAYFDQDDRYPIPPEATILHVLSHRVSFGDYVKESYDAGKNLSVLTKKDIETHIQQKTGVEVLEDPVYSNSCYFLLGLLIERVAEMPWEAFTQTFIFDPAEMKTARFTTEACGHEYGEGGYVEQTELVLNIAFSAGAICCSASDLLSFVKALRKDVFFPLPMLTHLLKSSSLSAHVDNDEEKGAYCIGGYVPGIEASLTFTSDFTQAAAVISRYGTGQVDKLATCLLSREPLSTQLKYDKTTFSLQLETGEYHLPAEDRKELLKYLPEKSLARFSTITLTKNDGVFDVKYGDGLQSQLNFYEAVGFIDGYLPIRFKRYQKDGAIHLSIREYLGIRLIRA
ncbi:beta-lactamase family protein [Grimontia kaedaensis]|uniref:Beta-lactamase family protein n=1 Tax=Grimontia kaedaensis TaxID=2872157 RepID=A0ABY4WSE9_9GAMM|nr:serine hydrolase domain-containing protein [Grimontia kaedaensis]USH02528.1 beta-lactamase family protein [Grimontia kaedaensis]